MSDEKTVSLQPDRERFEAWAKAAGDVSVSEWLAALADEAAGIGEKSPPITWPVRIPLRTPVDLGSQRITEIEMRRGRLGDIKGMKLASEMPTDHLFLVASRLSGQPIRVIESLDQDDAGEVMSVAMGFYGSCLGGGRTR